MKIYIVIILCLAIGCKTKKDSFNNKNCQTYNDKYVEYAALRMIDSALFYVNKSIKCDQSSDFYKFEKVKLLVSAEEYEMAYDYLDSLLSHGETVFKMYKGVLGLKLQKNEAIILLQEAYNYFNDGELKNYDAAFYKSGLDNYFEGKKYAEKTIHTYKQLFQETPYAFEILEASRNIIDNNNKEQVLYKMFNIN